VFPTVSVAASDSNVWAGRVIQTGDVIAAVVLEIDPADNSLGRLVTLNARPTQLALDGDALWVMCRGDGVLLRIDTGSGEVVATIPVPDPAHVAGSGSILKPTAWPPR
jgi:hypothetical protein